MRVQLIYKKTQIIFHQMNSFEELFVNSTNRFSAVKNIILSQDFSNSPPLKSSEHQNMITQNKKAFIMASCNLQEPSETFQQLQQKYRQLSLTIKQANQQKQMMTKLLNKIFKVQQGQQEKLSKRFRRKKNEIQLKFECKIANCNKIYSSSTSLVRHTKLKHAYATSEPPSHNYQIPPSPNLKHSNECQRRALGLKETTQKDGEESDKEGAASSLSGKKTFTRQTVRTQ